MEDGGMADPPKKDLVLEGLRLAYRDDGLDKVTQAAEAMSVAVPRLTDTELKQIADQVAAAIVADRLGTASEQDRTKWRRLIGDISYQLAIGVAGGGLYALLAYLANIASASFSSAGGADATDDPHRRAARAKLLETVAPDERKAVEELLSFPLLPSLVGVQLERQLEGDQAFRQLSSYLAGRDGRGATASASWWSRVRGASSAKPAVAGGGDGSVAQRLLVQSITKRVFFAVTRKTADKLKAS
jgi:hypothetical protein